MPQIELMQSDLPHTLYIKEGKVKAKEIDEATRLTQEAMERNRKRRESEAKKKREYTVNDIFNGIADNE